ncbi:MAG: hypothetical protein JWP01_3593 [Myxococcales bacterium]|nr:hypothetical protein [Myxococcales bacterium]
MSRRLLGSLAIAAVGVLTACKDKGAAAPTQGSAADLDKRCELVAKACGDKAKHVEKILDECKQAAKKQVAASCTDKAIATYDCYVKDLCGNGDKVWALQDVRVLADRHGKCVAEQTTLGTCGGN